MTLGAPEGKTITDPLLVPNGKSIETGNTVYQTQDEDNKR